MFINMSAQFIPVNVQYTLQPKKQSWVTGLAEQLMESASLTYSR